MDTKNICKITVLYMFILEGCIKAIAKSHHSNNVCDIKSYQLIILKRIFQSLSTINNLLSKEPDPISAYGILRMIIDSICAYCFIYERDDKEEVEFRHYLYLLDGCSKVNELVSAFKMENEIERTAEEDLRQNKCDLKKLQQGIENALKNHSYSKVYGDDVARIIRYANWKYIKIEGKGENKYTWKKIYKEIGCDNNYAHFISNYLSQYIHGLFLSNTLNPQAESHHFLIYSTLVHFERRLIHSIFRIYTEDHISEKFLQEMDSQKILNIGIEPCDVTEYLKELHTY